MSTQNNPADAAYTQTDLDKARAEGHAAGLAEGTKTERARVTGILTHAEAEGRTAQAIALVDTDLSAEAAGKVLAASPKINPTAQGKSAFERHMDALGNPKIGADGGDASGADSEALIIAQGVALLPSNRRPAGH